MDTEWIWTGLVYGLLAAAAACAVRWLWAVDTSRRGRCPDCGYDVSGIQVDRGAACPECGRRQPPGKFFRRHRPRWCLRAGATLLVLAYLASAQERIRARGWRGAVPTVVLVAIVPAVEPTFVDWGVLGEEAGDRGLPAEADGWLGPIARLRSNAAFALQDARTPEGEPVTLQWFDLSDFIEETPLETVFPRRHPYDDPIPMPRERALRNRQAYVTLAAENLIQRTVDPVGWVDNGGSASKCLAVGSWLAVVAPPAVQPKIQALLDMLRRDDGRQMVVELPGLAPDREQSRRVLAILEQAWSRPDPKIPWREVAAEVQMPLTYAWYDPKEVQTPPPEYAEPGTYFWTCNKGQLVVFGDPKEHYELRVPVAYRMPRLARWSLETTLLKADIPNPSYEDVQTIGIHEVVIADAQTHARIQRLLEKIRDGIPVPGLSE